MRIFSVRQVAACGLSVFALSGLIGATAVGAGPNDKSTIKAPDGTDRGGILDDGYKPVGANEKGGIYDDGTKPMDPKNSKGGVIDDSVKPAPGGDKAGATAIEYGKTVKEPNPAAGVYDDGIEPVDPKSNPKATTFDDGHKPAPVKEGAPPPK